MALSAEQLAAALRLTPSASSAVPAEYSDIVNRLLGATEALVSNYAPNAPEAVRDEAQVRVAGYLFDRPPDSPSAGALYYSGAQGLLGFYRTPPADAEPEVGEPSAFTNALEQALKPFAFANGRAIGRADLAAALARMLLPAPPDAEGKVLTSTESETIRVAVLGSQLYTMRLEAHALDSVNAVWQAGDFATVAEDGEFALPDPMPAGGGFVGIAVPAAAPDLTAITVGGFNQIGAFTKRADNIVIGGVEHEVWQSRRAWSVRSAGQRFALAPTYSGLPAWRDAAAAAALGAGAVAIANLAADVLARIAPALAGQGGKFLAVNAGESAVELVDAPSGGGGDLSAGAVGLVHLAAGVLARMAPALAGNAGKFLAVNGAANAVELVDEPDTSVGAGTIDLAKLAADALARMAPALAGNAGKHLAVNAAGNAVALVDAPAGGQAANNPFVSRVYNATLQVRFGPLLANAAQTPAVAPLATINAATGPGLLIVQTAWSEVDADKVGTYAELDEADDATGFASTTALYAAGGGNPSDRQKVLASASIDNQAGEKLGDVRVQVGINGTRPHLGIDYLPLETQPANAAAVNRGTFRAAVQAWFMRIDDGALRERLLQNLTGQGGKYLAVNAAANAIEAVEPPSANVTAPSVIAAHVIPKGTNATTHVDISIPAASLFGRSAVQFNTPFYLGTPLVAVIPSTNQLVPAVQWNGSAISPYITVVFPARASTGNVTVRLTAVTAWYDDTNTVRERTITVTGIA